MAFVNLYTFAILACICFSGIAGYTVVGNQIYDANNKIVRIRGVDRPSFEWNVNGEMASQNDYQLMANWGANVVRISLNQDFWLQSATASAYKNTIAQQYKWARAAGLGLIFDLHWNNGAQQNMADRNSITFWTQFANVYKNDEYVMFELYNEPHDVSWSQWLNGDNTYAGMQQMYNAVRATGANNVVVVGGLDWAFDLSGVSSGYEVDGDNIAYATHPYDYSGKQLADWPRAFGNLASTSPIIMTEFGQYCAQNTYVQDLLAYAEGLGVHWTAWAWYVSGCAFPSIISDWNGTPSSGVGQIVKTFLAGKGSSSTGSSSGSSSTPTSAPTQPPTQATNALTVFSSSLAAGWQDWSWSTSYSLSDSTFLLGGLKSIKFQVFSYQGIYLHTTTPFASGSYGSIQFYVNGGLFAVGATSLSVRLYGTAATQVGSSINFPASVPAGQWSLISIPISSFGISAATQISGFTIQSNVDGSVGTIYINSISFVPVAAATSAPTTAPTKAPTAAPTTKPTSAPTQAPTTAPTNAPTKAPTSAPTAAPTTAPTTAPTKAPTSAPTTKPTSAPTVSATQAPSTGCDASSIKITQTVGSSWKQGGQTITQYDVSISTTCNKKLTGLNMAVSGWSPVNFWNAIAASSDSTTSLALPSWAVVTSTAPFTFGYQNVGAPASFSASSFTFQQ